MRVFSMIVGKNRSEFSVDILDGKYVGKINEQIVCESTDYESVRTNILNSANADMSLNSIDEDILH